jgi:cytochrome c oxidase subunit I+III
MVDSVRRQTFDNTMLMWHYTVAQGLVALVIVQFFPSVSG